MSCFDMKSGYNHVDIRQEDRTFLGIEWEGEYFVFNVLPFGLAPAPMIFTKFGLCCINGIDNQAAVSIVNKGSPIEKLHELAEDIFDFMESIGSELDPIWVPRDSNVLADEASRLLDRDDWGIRKEIFDFCVQQWGQPSLEAYADIGSEGVDGFASSWNNEFVWAVPPPRLVPQGSVIFTPSTYENSTFNEPYSHFPFCFLYINCVL
ncbi:hypothetical protein QR680_017510 [Steinernema hermaphroditum]|uniref:Reverse transcriptase domain-containing protein n=1 Tax=Steinernema hermaphroditum TaxID=289476 RepID=A0AA39HEU7_9BILA|nr:hypothetical protein QR680_017510 [Steinernema hermaphroditum]